LILHPLNLPPTSDVRLMLVTLDDLEETILKIREFTGSAEEFKLRVAEEMNDPAGVNMANNTMKRTF